MNAHQPIADAMADIRQPQPPLTLHEWFPWRCVNTHEQACADWFRQRLGAFVYYPSCTISSFARARRAKKVVTVIRPVFSGYVFVSFLNGNRDFPQARHNPHSLGPIIIAEGTPRQYIATMRPREIVDLGRREEVGIYDCDQTNILRAADDLIGRNVQVPSGPYVGFQAVVVKLKKLNAVLKLSIFGHQTTMTVPVLDILKQVDPVRFDDLFAVLFAAEHAKALLEPV